MIYKFYMQTRLRDLPGLALEHCNKAGVTIKRAAIFLLVKGLVSNL